VSAPLFGVVLLATSLIPLGLFCAFVHGDTKWTAHRAEMERLTAPLPDERQDLREPGVQRTPGKALKDAGFVDTGWVSLLDPGEELLERVAAGLRGVSHDDYVANDYAARHRADDKKVIGSSAQQAARRALLEPTFDSLIAANWATGEREALQWRCDVCRGVVAEGEKPHDNCHGCGCPCTSPLVGQPGMVFA
jgi:hypothetical protein